MAEFVMTYTKVFSQPFEAADLESAGKRAKLKIAQERGLILLGVRTAAEQQAAVARGEVG